MMYKWLFTSIRKRTQELRYCENVTMIPIKIYSGCYFISLILSEGMPFIFSQVTVTECVVTAEETFENWMNNLFWKIKIIIKFKGNDFYEIWNDECNGIKENADLVCDSNYYFKKHLLLSFKRSSCDYQVISTFQCCVSLKELLIILCYLKAIFPDLIYTLIFCIMRPKFTQNLLQRFCWNKQNRWTRRYVLIKTVESRQSIDVTIISKMEVIKFSVYTLLSISCSTIEAVLVLF